MGHNWVLDIFLDFGGDIAFAAIAAPAFLCGSGVIQTRILLTNAPTEPASFCLATPILRRRRTRIRVRFGFFKCAMMREHQRGQAALANNLRRPQIADGLNIHFIRCCG